MGPLKVNKSRIQPKKAKTEIHKNRTRLKRHLGHWTSECTDKENIPPDGNKKKISSPKKPSLKRENAIPYNSEAPKIKGKTGSPPQKKVPAI